MRYAGLAALAAMLAPMAHAQAGCEALNRIVAAAPEGFEPILAEEIDDDYFRPTVWLSRDAVGCYVDLTLRDVYSCGWNFSTLADAETRFAAVAGGARSCLAGWTEKDQSGKDTPTGIRMHKGAAFGAGPGAHSNTVVAIYIQSIAADRHSVQFEVTRF